MNQPGVGQPPLGELLAVDEELSLTGLTGPVDAVRDVNGRTHIYATSVTDALLVQGYLSARDRGPQMEVMRRFATGRVCEVFCGLDPSMIESDISFRMLGMHRVAQDQYDASSDQLRAYLDAYASGVSQLFAEIRSGDRETPRGVIMLEPKHFTEWTAVDSLAFARLLGTAVDSLAFARLLEWQLSYDTDDIGLTALLDGLRSTFPANDADPLVAARAGMERDLLRFAAPDDATIIDGLGSIGESALSFPGPGDGRAKTPGDRTAVDGLEPGWSVSHAELAARRLELAAAARGYQRGIERLRELLAGGHGFGSNNWAVAPERSATGNALLASDPHLALESPATFWPVSLHVTATEGEVSPEDLHAAGLSFPGTPAIILGHNENVAWGATVTYTDVTDVYVETLSSDGEATAFEGQDVPLEIIEEDIVLDDGSTYTYEVQVVPHHGPIIPTIEDGKVVSPDPNVGALSVRWTGFEVTHELEGVFGLLRATDVDEARAALDQFDVGGQNWMLADTSGNIAWTSHIMVPYRDDAALQWNPTTYEGTLPCLLLPGDGTAEWTGFWDDDAVPWAKNPTGGYLATANNDPVGGTLDNDPSNDQQSDGSSGFLACSYAHGFRAGSVKRRIDAHTDPFELDDMSSIQADVRSPMGSRVVPALLLAIDAAQAEEANAGSHPDLTAVVNDPAYDSSLIAQVEASLIAWQDEADFEARSGVDPDDNQAISLDEVEGRAAQATLVFNAFLVRFINRVFGDELARIDMGSGTRHDVRGLLLLLESDPANLATYDANTGDSALWDDLDTVEVESRQERMIRALLDGLTWLQANADGSFDDWRWGYFHTLRFSALVSVWGGILSNPTVTDTVFAGGYPRHGDMFVVDAAHYDIDKGLAEELDFSYGSGPNQRFVAELNPDGLVVKNVLPGGAVFDADDPHFGDQAEEWRRNEVHEVPFVLDDVLAAAESRTLIWPTQ
ncbi:MAG: penicillin acylase family protein [Deltaproteobacteria bacterium]|nr:penicillin acylase family protein [Deltaproteobacteria bacterium]